MSLPAAAGNNYNIMISAGVFEQATTIINRKPLDCFQTKKRLYGNKN